MRKWVVLAAAAVTAVLVVRSRTSRDDGDLWTEATRAAPDLR